MRGVSPVVSTVLLLLVTVSVLALIFPFVSEELSSLRVSVESARQKVERASEAGLIILPPPLAPPYSASEYPIIIHNTGFTSLSNVRGYITYASGDVENIEWNKMIEKNGDVVDVPSSWATSYPELCVGCALLGFVEIRGSTFSGSEIYVLSDETGGRYVYP